MFEFLDSLFNWSERYFLETDNEPIFSLFYTIFNPLTKEDIFMDILLFFICQKQACL